MFDKIKAFFNKKIVKVVSWILTGLGIVSLLLGGIGVVDINSFTELLATIVSLISGLIAFITERCKKA